MRKLRPSRRRAKLNAALPKTSVVALNLDVARRKNSASAKPPPARGAQLALEGRRAERGAVGALVLEAEGRQQGEACTHPRLVDLHPQQTQARRVRLEGPRGSAEGS